MFLNGRSTYEEKEEEEERISNAGYEVPFYLLRKEMKVKF